MVRSDVGIVIPAYNEDATISDVVDEMLKYGDVIVVDDSSSDSTVSKVLKSGGHVICHTSNKGYEAALSSGFEYAEKCGYQYIVTADADGELPATGVNDVVKLLKYSSVVVGKRREKNRIIEYIFGGITGFIWGIEDPLCGLKGYKSDLYKKYGFFDKNKMIGTELLAYAIRDKALINQVSIDVSKRKGESRYGNDFRVLLKIIRCVIMFFSISLSKSGEK